MIEKKKGKVKRKTSTSRQGSGNAGKGKGVEFTLLAPGAKEVFLAGEFNSWDTLSLPMTKDRNGVWKTKIPLSPGCYQYKFFMDGAWRENLEGEESICNPYGTHNLIKVVR